MAYENNDAVNENSVQGRLMRYSKQLRLADSRTSALTMYGILLESVEHYVRLLYGDENWQAVRERASITNKEFTTHCQYPNEYMTRIADACAHVLKDKEEAKDFMRFFGHCFVDFFRHYGYDQIMRISGRHYRDFLHGIDNLHETMRFSYPKLRSPSFFVEKEDSNGCILHYRSKRVGFSHYVIGQLECCGKTFYDVEVKVRILSEETSDSSFHVVFRLDFDNSAYIPAINKVKLTDHAEYSPVELKVFFKVFPFSIVFNDELVVQNTGENLHVLFGDRKLSGCDLRKLFRLRRPRMEFTWENLFCLQRVVFELEAVDLSTKQKPLKKAERSNKRTELILRGQMKFIEKWNAMAFLCNPLLGNIKEMQEVGLYINDLNMHDNSRDMVLAGWQHASTLEYSIEKQIEKSKQIEETVTKLDHLKHQSESLLYSMIPKSIAVKLKNGENPMNTCQIFREVTIMFSYLIGFTGLFAKVPPMEAVQVISSMFTLFDTVSDKYDVFKVETLGDAVYMVAGGVPDWTPNHATNVAGLALDLTKQICSLDDPSNPGKSLMVQIGMHTGGVVAGVVGKKMPQYCLFGDTVNTASRMQSYSRAGLVHVSEPCNHCLQGDDYVTVYRGTGNVKGKGEMKTYWLVGRKTDPDIEQKVKLLQSRPEEKITKAPAEPATSPPQTETNAYNGLHTASNQ
ncbi:soluble guanylate cyclase 88E-like isoform X2 [Lineus longissimus]|uniref:soluble guanylate cyclase 88E-like isoform X2 n=1 Tax=Lineus longissimus TaxID=88925 RepID=UPI00315CBD1D